MKNGSDFSQMNHTPGQSSPRPSIPVKMNGPQYTSTSFIGPQLPPHMLKVLQDNNTLKQITMVQQISLKAKLGLLLLFTLSPFLYFAELVIHKREWFFKGIPWWLQTQQKFLWCDQIRLWPISYVLFCICIIFNFSCSAHGHS